MTYIALCVLFETSPQIIVMHKWKWENNNKLYHLKTFYVILLKF